MRGRIISYLEMCQEANIGSLQRGMHFNQRVVLMSVRPGAPYRDVVDENSGAIEYEGHDERRGGRVKDPKLIDQPEFTQSGNLTENGKFHRAAQDYQSRGTDPLTVRVFEKIKSGIWSDNGHFMLVDSWRESDGRRQVFRFQLEAIDDGDERGGRLQYGNGLVNRSRIIPTPIKIEVWRRDQGRCVECGATEDLHFDHIVPYSKGGTSLTADNVQILCGHHNSKKGAKIR